MSLICQKARRKAPDGGMPYGHSSHAGSVKKKRFSSEALLYSMPSSPEPSEADSPPVLSSITQRGRGEEIKWEMPQGSDQNSTRCIFNKETDAFLSLYICIAWHLAVRKTKVNTSKGIKITGT